MKKVSLLTIHLFLLVNCMAQKPRYFTGIPRLCPIDYNSLSQPKGLKENSNRVSLSIDSNTLIKSVTGILDDANNPIANTKISVTNYDTSFLITKIAKRYYAFDVIQEIGNYSIIKYWTDNREDEKKEDVKSFLNTLTNQQSPFSIMTMSKTYKVGETKVNDTKDYYLTKNEELQKYSKEFEYKKNRWSMGLLVLPVKLRTFADTTGQFEFSDGFSLGTSFSWTLNHKWVNDKTYNLVLYAGVSSISVDSLKTRGATNADKIPAFSPAIGFMIEKSGIQIGAFLGWDFPLGKIQKDWIYRNRPWIGIGLGFSIFKIQSQENIEPGTNK